MSVREPGIEEIWGWLRAHEKHLNPIAKAVMGGKRADIAGSAANVFVALYSGSPLAGSVAHAVTRKCAEVVGSWFANPDQKTREAAADYVRAVRGLQGKFEFAKIVKARLMDAQAGLDRAIAERDFTVPHRYREVRLGHEDMYLAMLKCLDAHYKAEAEAARLKTRRSDLCAELLTELKEPPKAKLEVRQTHVAQTRPQTLKN